MNAPSSRGEQQRGHHRPIVLNKNSNAILGRNNNSSSSSVSSSNGGPLLKPNTSMALSPTRKPNTSMALSPTGRMTKGVEVMVVRPPQASSSSVSVNSTAASHGKKLQSSSNNNSTSSLVGNTSSNSLSFNCNSPNKENSYGNKANSLLRRSFDLSVEFFDRVVDLSNLVPLHERSNAQVQKRSLDVIKLQRRRTRSRSTPPQPQKLTKAASTSVDSFASDEDETDLTGAFTIANGASTAETVGAPSLYPTTDRLDRIPDCNVDRIFRSNSNPHTNQQATQQMLERRGQRNSSRDLPSTGGGTITQRLRDAAAAPSYARQESMPLSRRLIQRKGSMGSCGSGNSANSGNGDNTSSRRLGSHRIQDDSMESTDGYRGRPRGTSIGQNISSSATPTAAKGRQTPSPPAQAPPTLERDDSFRSEADESYFDDSVVEIDDGDSVSDGPEIVQADRASGAAFRGTSNMRTLPASATAVAGKSRLDRQASVPSIYFQRQSSFDSVSSNSSRNSRAASFRLKATSRRSLLGGSSDDEYDDDEDNQSCSSQQHFGASAQVERADNVSSSTVTRRPGAFSVQPTQQAAPQNQRASFRTLQRDASSSTSARSLSSRGLGTTEFSSASISSRRIGASLNDSEHSMMSSSSNHGNSGGSAPARESNIDYGGNNGGSGRQLSSRSTMGAGGGMMVLPRELSNRRVQQVLSASQAHLLNQSTGTIVEESESSYQSEVPVQAQAPPSLAQHLVQQQNVSHRQHDDADSIGRSSSDGGGGRRRADRQNNRYPRSRQDSGGSGTSSFYGDETEVAPHPHHSAGPPSRMQPPPQHEYNSQQYHPQQERQQNNNYYSSQSQPPQSHQPYYQQQQQPPPQQMPLRPLPPPPSRRQCLEIEISPGVYAPLHGADETWAAISEGHAAYPDCLCCGTSMICMAHAEYVLCPSCKVVSPVVLDGSRRNSGGGVGLGLRKSDYNGPSRGPSNNVGSGINGGGSNNNNNNNNMTRQYQQPQQQQSHIGQQDYSQMPTRRTNGRRIATSQSERYVGYGSSQNNVDHHQQRYYNGDHGSYY